jgi:predicted secreted Zn-dependent protease
MPDESNPHHALTAANLAVDARCNKNAIAYEVKCVFLPTESWSKNKQSEKLLVHEQLHFDLTEVHARMLRKKLKSLGGSCNNFQPRLSEAVSIAFKNWKAEQDLFDAAVKHGLDEEEQQAWAVNIAQRLQALNAYQQ